VKKRSKIGIAVVCLGLLLLAGVRMLFHPVADRIMETRLDFRGDAYWKYAFLKTHPFLPDDSGFGLHAIHPTRGWTCKPNGTPPEGTLKLTNSQGLRAVEDYVFAPDKFRIMVVGDSFTFGLFDNHESVWPLQLQQQDDRLSVVNLAVSGYGIDQMYITLHEEMANYKPHLVIFALITEDMDRSMLGFREYQKPRFILENTGELRLTNVPIGSLADTLKHLRQRYESPWGYYRLARENQQVLQAIEEGRYEAERDALNQSIIEHAIACTREYGAGFMLIHLASNLEISLTEMDRENDNTIENYLRSIATKEQVDFFSTRRAFLNGGQDWVVGHYTALEAAFVAKRIYEQLQQHEAWINWRNRTHTHNIPRRALPATQQKQLNLSKKWDCLRRTCTP